MLNKVTLMGRLTKDPMVKYSQGGTAIARYTLAIWLKWKICRKIPEKGQENCCMWEIGTKQLYKRRRHKSLCIRCCDERTLLCG